MPTPTLRCRDCGHTWKARTDRPRSPQCSKCRSRKIGSSADSAIVDNSTAKPASPSQPDAREEIDEVLSHMVKDFKALLYHLKGDQVVDDATFYTTMLSVCPFCGAANEYGMMYSGKMSKWVCLSCGTTV